MKIATLTILIALLAACGQPHRMEVTPDTPLQKMFERGRLHRFFPKQRNESLALAETAAEVVAVKQLGDSPYASWLQFDTRLMPNVETAALPDQLNILAAQYDWKIEEWIPAERFMRRDESRLFLNYERRVKGWPVRDNVLQLVYGETQPGIFRLSEIQSNITGPAPEDLNRDPPEADAAWLEDLTGRSDLVVEDSFPEWIPFLEEGRFHWQKALVLTWLMDGEPYQATLLPEPAVWIDAYPLAVHAKAMLTRALKRSYAEEGPREYPLSFSAVNSPSGNFMLGAEAWLPKDFEPATVGLSGTRAMVIDNHATDALSYAGLQEQPNSFFLPDDPSRLAAVNAFVAVQRINRFARQFLSADDSAFLNQPLVVNVNLAEQSCNAYYSPRAQRLLLYKEGGGCANMALLNDVIYHEWGHALDDHVGRTPGILDPAFSEGLADVTAAFYNNDPAIAPYFVFDDPEPIRNLMDARSYPEDRGPIHYEGGIIASTFWELRQRLIERYGLNRGAHLAGKFFFRHLLAVDTYLESYGAVLRIDDDDNNPATPGPNHCLINEVFAHHGLADSESCEDKAPARAAISQDLTLALLDAGPEENAVHLLAAAPAAEGMAVCLGSRGNCSAKKSSWLPLELIGRQPERAFFMLPHTVLLPSLTLVTLFRLDAQGAAVESRELKIFSK